MQLVWAARKIGLGLRPEDDVSVPVEDWLEAQLTESFPRLAIETVARDNPPVVEWPSRLTYDLKTRIERITAMRARSDELDRMTLDPLEDDAQRNANWAKYSMRSLDEYRFANAAIYGADQVKQRLAHFWLNHFTVGWKETTPELIGDYWEAIYAQLDGSFADLLYRVTSHPAMLTYLDNIYNIGYHSEKAKGCDFDGCVIGLNDNLARELMELHTVSPARGYSESDIHNGAMVLAGWGDIFDRPWDKPPKDWAQPWAPYHAEPGKKTVLGTVIPDGQKGLRVLTDMLSADPATRRFVSSKLARHFIGESASDADIGAIEAAWESSQGDLPTIHRAVLSRALSSPERRFHWPLTWFFQMLRMSGATLLRGYEDIGKDLGESISREPDHVLGELGNSFWAIRQPNGYSDRRADWISTEHLDRRIRLAQMTFNGGAPRLSPEEMIVRNELGDAAMALVQKGSSPMQRFVLLFCGPDLTEV